MGFLGFLIIGLIAGAIARLLVPGQQAMGCLLTMGLGCIGSFVGGILGSVVRGDGFDLHASGLIGSTIGAIIVLLILGYTRRNNPPM